MTYALFVVQRRLCLLHYFISPESWYTVSSAHHSGGRGEGWRRAEELPFGFQPATTHSLWVLSIDYLASHDLFLMRNVWTLTRKCLSWYSNCLPNTSFMSILYSWPAQAQDLPSFTRVDDQQNNLLLPALTYNNVHLSCTHQCPQRSHDRLIHIDINLNTIFYTHVVGRSSQILKSKQCNPLICDIKAGHIASTQTKFH